ncbi:MAG: trigger factor [Bdellovibrionales bacterium GWB1_52_6]|nr:MAG: trigger factor [Bdellovibrionales bacterium GWB1_52_6]
MQFNIEMEKTSNIVRKFTISVPAQVIANRFEKGLAEVQRTAKIKGFRPGHVPISVVKQYYADDVRGRVFNSLIDESYQEAVREHKIATVGSPKIEGLKDQTLGEDKEFTYTATVEVLPEIEAKGYTGLALTKEPSEVNDGDIEKVIENIRSSHAELNPIDGPAKKGDFADVTFSGGLITDNGLEEKPGMKGTRMIELGSNSMIPGFEDNLEGMKKTETKTFKIKFPKDYQEKDFASKQAEFTVTVNEVKEKKLPELNEEFSKNMGYDTMDELKKNIREHVQKDKTEESERKVRSDLMQMLIDKNKFDVPGSLIEAQTRALAQDWSQELKRQGFNDEMIKQAVTTELENLKKRAESQVRASLILESIAKQEKVEIKPEDFEAELQKVAGSMKVGPEKLKEFYAKDPGRKEDFIFRMRQEKTVSFLIEKAKIKNK